MVNKVLARLSLFSFFVISLQSMEKPPVALVRVCTIDDSRHWELEEDVIEQISNLSNQKKDSPGLPLMLTPAVTADNFTQLLALVGQKKVRKKLKSKTTAELAQLTRDADCLGVQKLVPQALKMLRSRVSDDVISELPETLGQPLGEMVFRKNAYVKSILYQAFSLASVDQNKKILSRAVCFSGRWIELHQDKKLYGIIDRDRIGINHKKVYHVIHESSINKSIIFSDSSILFVDMVQDQVVKIWDLPREPKFLLIYDKGAIVKLVPERECWGQMPNHDIYIYDVEADCPHVITPCKGFLWAEPEALALNADRTKLIAGSGNGLIMMCDLRHPEIEPSVYNGCGWLPISALDSNPKLKRGVFDFNRGWISALAIDAHEKYIAVCDPRSGLGLWSLRKKAHHTLTMQISALEQLKFNKKGNLLFEITADGRALRIWSVCSKTLVHLITMGGPMLRNSDDLAIDKDDLGVTIGRYSEDQMQRITLCDKPTYEQLQHAPFAVIAFLARMGKKINEKKLLSAEDKKEFALHYEFLPASVQKLLTEHVML